MAESRVLIIDADEARAEQLRVVFDFIEHRAVVVADSAELDLAQCRQQDWLAVVVGSAPMDTLQGFVDWLRRDRLHPPLLVLQPHHESLLQRFGLDRSACLSLETPVRQAPLAELLRRAALLHAERGGGSSRRYGGPSGNSARCAASAS